MKTVLEVAGIEFNRGDPRSWREVEHGPAEPARSKTGNG
jgi:hypothetical protein